MSANSVTVVRLGSVEGAAAVADRVTSWLLENGVIEANPDRSCPRASQFMPGPQHRQVIVDPHRWFESPGPFDGVDIHRDPMIFPSMENYEPPYCARCRTDLDHHEYAGYISAWETEGEPEVACASCGWAGLLGDWPGKWANGVGAPAVEFHNWPPLTTRFLAELRAHVGLRTKIVYKYC